MSAEIRRSEQFGEHRKRSLQNTNSIAENGSLCTLLVSSFDGYSDLWEPYFALLRLRWPDCPFPVSLITEERDPQIPGVEPLRLGGGLDWSSLVLRALEKVGTPYVLFSLEDFFLRSQVDTARLLELYASFRQHRLRMLRLIPRPGPDVPVSGEEFGMIQDGSPYRVSTQAALWDVSALQKLLRPGESAWQFELNGTLRSAGDGGFAAVWKSAFPYRHHVVEKGQWFPWDAWQFSRLPIGVDLDARARMSISRSMLWLVRKAAKSWLYRQPAQLLRRVRAKLPRNLSARASR